tara:strand:+ start:12789 stop:13286 length:498 start_codon:yes stop_codon:yes gene_type:complete
MSISSPPHHTIRLGELLLVLFIGGISVAYLFDARGASLSVQNLLLIQPLTILVGVLCFYLIFKILRPRPARVDVDGLARESSRASRYAEEIKVAAMLVLMTAYVLSLEAMGMDTATFLFIAASLLLQGERRWQVVMPVSLVSAVLIVWGFGLMTPFPMNNLIMPG